MQFGTRSQSTKSEAYSINGMCIQVYSSRLLVGVQGYGETHKLFGDKILKIPQPTNKKKPIEFLSFFF